MRVYVCMSVCLYVLCVCVYVCVRAPYLASRLTDVLIPLDFNEGVGEQGCDEQGTCACSNQHVCVHVYPRVYACVLPLVHVAVCASGRQAKGTNIFHFFVSQLIDYYEKDSSLTA
jgi:hypothetical protein